MVYFYGVIGFGSLFIHIFPHRRDVACNVSTVGYEMRITYIRKQPENNCLHPGEWVAR
jgi:hypothetical protein